MAQKAKRVRLFALMMTVVLLMSTITVAGAADTVDDAKDKLGQVDITQTYNGKEVDSATHNYRTKGKDVSITYEATLQMTQEMAEYLCARQGNLMDAKFNVHVNMDMGLLEFATDENDVSITFTSAFLKPWDADENSVVQYPEAFAQYAGKYESELLNYESGLFTYEIKVEKAWALGQDSFDIPMELIVYYDDEAQEAYSYQEVKDKYSRDDLADMSLMYGGFTEDDWMTPIKATLADMQVQEWVEPTVTTASSTWQTVKASGTVDGEFSYIGESAANSIAILLGYEDAGYVNTVEFGNESTIEEWTSNDVEVRLIRQAGGSTPDVPDSPYLNLDDHFAYIIGMPDGLVHPEQSITRAEVATIFFRMLTDEVRNEYWSTTNPYSDVDSDDWYNNAISTLTKLGVVEGMPDGTFLPTDSITRAEFATMAVRFFTDTEEFTWEEDAFSDISGHWANEYINLAYLLNVISGYPDGTYLPDNAITRAEAMTIVNNTLRRTPTKEGLLPVEDMITWPDNMDATVWYYEAVQEATNSHTYSYPDEAGNEQWSEALPVRDWAAFERAWSDANSAANPGEVVDSE